MKEKLTRNLGYKLLSVPLAALLWLVIINLDDPVLTKNIPNVLVEVLNESYIDSSGRVYDIEQGRYVTVTIKAKRTVRDKIKASDIRVTADLSNITLYQKVEIVAECPKYQSEITEITTNPKMLTVTLEDRATEARSVQVAMTGNVDAGFYVDSVEASPNIIEISGAASVIERIAEVRVMVGVGGARKSFSQTGLVPKVYDKKGTEIDASRLTFSHSEIDVNVNIIPTKVVPIKVKTEGDALFGYAVTGLEYDPGTVEIAGSPEVLADIESITIPVDINGVNGEMEKNIDLASYIPEGTKLVGEITAIAIRVKVEKLATREFAIPIDNLDVRNLPEEYEFRANIENGIFYVTVLGLEEKIALLTLENLNVYIDLSDMGAGTHMVILGVEPPEGIYLYGTPKISITLLEASPPEEEELLNEGEEVPDEGDPADEEEGGGI